MMTPVARRLNFDTDDEAGKMLDYNFTNDATDFLYRRTPFNQRKQGRSKQQENSQMSSTIISNHSRVQTSYGEKSQRLDAEYPDEYDIQPSLMDMNTNVPSEILRKFSYDRNNKFESRIGVPIKGMDRAPLALIAKNMDRPTKGPFRAGGPEHRRFEEQMKPDNGAATAVATDSAEDIKSAAAVHSSSLLSRQMCVAANQQQYRLEIYGRIDGLVLNGKQILP